MRLANLTSGEAAAGGDGVVQLVSSMVCSFADTPPSADAADAASTTLDVAFGAVSQSLGHSMELVDGMPTCDAKSSQARVKRGSQGRWASKQVCK